MTSYHCHLCGCEHLPGTICPGSLPGDALGKVYRVAPPDVTEGPFFGPPRPIESSYDPEVEEQLARELYGPKGYGYQEKPGLRPSTLLIWVVILLAVYGGAIAIHHWLTQ